MQWLEAIIKYITDWFPRKYFINPDEGGVRITLGKYVGCLKPGWYYHWPVIQECKAIFVTPQVVDLRPQSALTNDLENVVISGGIKYRVNDAQKAILGVHSYDESIQTMALGIICCYVAGHNFEDLNDLTDLREAILTGIREEAAGMGLKIMKVYITDIGKTKNVRVMGGSNYIETDTETDNE